MAAPLGVATLSEMRTRLELMLSINSSSSYVGSTPELQDVNEGYQATAYAYDWPHLLTRAGIAKVADLDRYGLPTNFRKARTIKLDGSTLREVELEDVFRTRNSFAIDRVQNDVILSSVPGAASTAFNITNSPSASNAASITLTSSSGLSAHEEVWIDSVSGTDEVTMISSISGNTVTARLFAAKSASDQMYRIKDAVDLLYYKRVPLLASASDTTILPSSVDFILLEYSAYVAYRRLEQFDEAARALQSWKDLLAEAWRASDKNSTGEATSFAIA